MQASHRIVFCFNIMISLLVFAQSPLVTGLAWCAPPSQYSQGCSDCHGMPPIDSQFRNLTTGSFNGNHQRHASSSASSCVCCHPGAASFGYGHMTSIVFVSANINGSPAGGQYKVSGTQVTFRNLTSSPELGSCVNVNCHFEAATAQWGSANFSTSADCSSCHPVPGSSTSHARHDQYYSWAANGCTKCHADYKTGFVFSHATSAGKRGISVLLEEGGYSGNGLNYLPSQSGTRVFGSCSNLYCHSNGTSVSTGSIPDNSTVNWGTAGPLACSSCHGNPPAYASDSPKKNSHVKHNYTCNICHSVTTATGSTIASVAAHVNNSYNVDQGGSATFSYAYNASGSTCVSVSCHSDGTGVWTGSVVPSAATATWGGSGACYSCHGADSAYNDYREALPAYTDGTPKPNAHGYHVDRRTTPSSDIKCVHCHASVTSSNTAIDGAVPSDHANGTYNVAGGGTYFDGDNTMNSTTVTVNLSYAGSPGVSSCNTVSCHPVGLDVTTVPPAPKTRSGSSVKWNSSGVCIDCHNIDMQSTSTFHHAMRNYSSGYPVQSPYSSSVTGVNTYARRCTMCHVDHNIFSPLLNSSNSLGRAGNLRTDIAVTPTVSGGYSNKDYIKSAGGTGGICISCHSAARVKDTARRRNDYPANTTPIVTQGQYSGSGHQYDVSAKFMSDGSTVYGNCSKCHNALLNETSVFMNATSTYQFGNHNSGIRRLQGSLDAAGGETAEEQICYRCHSLISDADPGGGPPKGFANKDFYGVAPMSLAAQDIFAANKDFRSSNATYSTTSKLYFKPVAAESPSEPMPNQHNSGDTFAGGTWIGRAMSPWETATSYETKSQVTSAAGTNYWRMITFTSPAVYTTTTVPAGNWLINVYCRESSTAQNAKIRYMVYKWNSGDTLGTTIISKGTYATELATTAAPGAVRQIAVNVGAITLAAGEKIAVDLELDTTSSYTTSYTASFYFGSRAPSNLTLPGSVDWSYADPGAAGYGHRVQHYTGIHLPSTRNETLSYIARNRHIECVDCHNPHATRNGLHGDYGVATGGSSNTLVNGNKNWVPNQFSGEYINIISGTGAGQTATIAGNTASTVTISSTWTAPASGSVYRIVANSNRVSNTQRGVTGASVSYSGSWANGSYTMVQEATYEYEICFKCHAATDASTNTMRYWNVTSVSLGAARWTNVGLEFNPNNPSYHPVIQPLPSTGNRRLNSAALTGGWAPGEVMSCSDCHGRDTGTSATAQGPHGSTVKWLLTGTYQNWPFTSASANGTASGGTLLSGTGTTTVPANNFCFNCHTWAAGGYGHTKSAGGHNKPCVNCHIRVPHGGKVPRLLTGANVPARYKPDGNGGAFSGAYLTSAVLPASGYMGATSVSCTSICGGKHTDNSTKAYAW